ncbi:MAG: 50S ribosomal protein L9 [Deltaproteobacteria bacterium]|nr:50S ribosomal protein L9 [Deltaproteobacteria bacterium]
MKLILKETIDSLGVRGKIVNVKPGYARNFLIPKGLAVPATDVNIRQLENERYVIEASLIRERDLAEEVARKIESITSTIRAKAGEGDRLYGSITNMDIAKNLLNQGIEIDRKKILLDEPIKTLGETKVSVKLHPDVVAELTVNVVKE